jgi:hypothetical protein
LQRFGHSTGTRTDGITDYTVLRERDDLRFCWPARKYAFKQASNHGAAPSRVQSL